MKDIANETMPQEDIELFESMRGEYVSAEEKTFFEKLEWKEEEEWTTQGDLILSEKDNDDRIYLMRICYNEYHFGKDYGAHPNGAPNVKGFYAMSLAQVLNANISRIGMNGGTFLQWLREHNYNGVKYDVNLDE